MREQSSVNQSMALAVSYAGRQVDLARALNVSRAAVCVWCRQGYVPVARAVEIEKLYGVRRSELVNPKLIQLINQ